MENDAQNDYYRWLQSDGDFAGIFPMQEDIMRILSGHGFKNRYTGWLVSAIVPWDKHLGHDLYDELLDMAELEIRLRTNGSRLKVYPLSAEPFSLKINDNLYLADAIKLSIVDSLEKWQYPAMKAIQDYAHSAGDNPNSIKGHLREEEHVLLMDSYFTKKYGRYYYRDDDTHFKLAEAASYLEENRDNLPGFDYAELEEYRYRGANSFLLYEYINILSKASYSQSEADQAILGLRTKWNTILKADVVRRIVRIYERYPVKYETKGRLIKPKPRNPKDNTADSPEKEYIREVKALLQQPNEVKSNKYVIAQYLYYLFTGNIIRKGNLDDNLAAMVCDVMRELGYLPNDDRSKGLSNSDKKKSIKRFLELSEDKTKYKQIGIAGTR